MTKRADGKFQRNARDFYRTPYEAVVPLLPHIRNIKRYIEPCAGDGCLISNLSILAGLQCVYASDIEASILSQFPIQKKDALSWTFKDLLDIKYREWQTGVEIEHMPEAFITNPPWSREILHPMIEVLAGLIPTWLLFDSDWAYTVQAAPYMEYCQRIVAVGRVCWFPETKMSGFDNASWYLFYRMKKTVTFTEFYGRGYK